MSLEQIKRKCPNCSNGRLHTIDGVAPYFTKHYQCDLCDSTYALEDLPYRDLLDELSEGKKSPNVWKAPTVGVDKTAEELSCILFSIESYLDMPDRKKAKRALRTALNKAIRYCLKKEDE
jgi:hypothetical protein